MIRIRRAPEPLSDQSAAPGELGQVLTAQSNASRILQQELRRYCEGQIQGRSFLVSGHRGAGKTTMVADALGSLMRLQQASAVGPTVDPSLLRPLPVMLHGPSLFRALPSDMRRAAAKQAADAAAPAPEPAAGSPPSPVVGAVMAALHVLGTAPPPPAPAPPPAAPPIDEDAKVELQALLALKQIILGLHRAVLREYSAAYRRALLADDQPATSAPLAERGELAAQFELELMEDPPATRLRELWDRAGALERGILQPLRASADQGMRELAALNGICNAHQRISGELSGEVKQKSDDSRSSERTTGIDPQLADAIKPAAAVLSGALVGGGSIAGQWVGGLGGLALGVGVALASSLAFKRSASSSVKRERHVDKTFIPDLSLRTLDRVLPMLLERLRGAGLAPVFVIDELDKVDGLSDRIREMVRYLKKLVAESVFTCFLTDRGYMESLRLAARQQAYGVASSYFSHALLIAHEPADLAAHLDEVLEIEPQASASQSDVADKDVLMWVLRHRSQMHALNLTRELVAMRSPAGQLNLQPAVVRDAMVYRIDATLQVVIEFFLNSPRVVGWSMQRIDMRQTLLDALYFISRAWLRGEEGIDLREAWRDGFRDALFGRMNLGEVYLGGDDGATASLNDAARRLISDDDLTVLLGTVGEMAALLGRSDLSDHIDRAWPVNRHQRSDAPPAPRPVEVVRGLLLKGAEGFLQQEPGPEPSAASAVGRKVYRFRYWPSGEVRVPESPSPQVPLPATVAQPAAAAAEATAPAPPAAPAPPTPVDLHLEAVPLLERVEALEISLASLLQGREVSAPAADHADLQLMVDEALVLPQNPPWQQAMVSHQALLQAADGLGNVGELKAHLVRLAAFARMLNDSGHALGPALQVAGFLTGVESQPSGDLRGGMVRALRLLARGLDFARRKPEEVVRALRKLEADIRESLLAAPLIGPDGSLGPEALRRLSALRAQGRAFGRRQDWAQRSAAAWQQLQQRLDAQDRGRETLSAQRDELLCAIRPEGPGRLLPDLVRQAALADWSRLLLTMLTPAGERAADKMPPFALARSTLLRLGLGRAHLQWLPALCEALQAPAGEPPEAGQQLQRELVELIAARSGRSRSSSVGASGAVLVLRRPQTSMTDGWTETPTRAMCLALSADEIEADTMALPASPSAPRETVGRPPSPPEQPLPWLKLLPQPLHVVWEPHDKPPPPWLENAAQGAGTTVSTLHRLLSSTQRPDALLGARGADELVALLRDSKLYS